MRVTCRLGHARRARAIGVVSVLTWLGLPGCGGTNPTATFIAPAYGDPCSGVVCGNGKCVAQRNNEGPSCSCDASYGGAHCDREVCGAGFHWDSRHECVPDQSCAAQPQNPCGAHGVCDDRTGVLACECDPGYDGPRCELCVSGFGRNAYGECVQLTLTMAGPPSQTFSNASSNSPWNNVVPANNSGAGNNASSGGDAGNHQGGGQDAGPQRDAGNHDAGTEDAGHQDAGSHDAGSEDAGNQDAGNHDAGTQDASSVCSPDPCNGHGQCAANGASASCSCNAGYAGAACDSCASGYHMQGGACVVDQTCATDSCQQHGVCSTPFGVITCTCDSGYAGSSCDACASGYLRNGSACEPCMTPLESFESYSDFPSSVNTCFADTLPYHITGMTLTSIGGDGTVWKCAANTLYKFDSQHVALEAGADYPAEIAFDQPVTTLSFNYAARLGALDAEILADDQMLSSLSQVNDGKGTLALSFSSPVTKLGVRSLSGVTSQIAIDDIEYTLAACMP